MIGFSLLNLFVSYLPSFLSLELGLSERPLHYIELTVMVLLICRAPSFGALEWTLRSRSGTQMRTQNLRSRNQRPKGRRLKNELPSLTFSSNLYIGSYSNRPFFLHVQLCGLRIIGVSPTYKQI